MRVNVHVERLVLEGVGVDGDGRLVGEAMRAELGRLFGQSAVPNGAFALHASTAQPIIRNVNAASAQLGTSIAQTVHGAIVK